MNPDVSFFVDLVGNIGALGFIFWLVWRTTNHTIPRLAQSFEESVDKSRADFREELKEQRVDFRNMLAEQRTFFADHMDQCRTSLDRVQRALHDSEAGHSVWRVRED